MASNLKFKPQALVLGVIFWITWSTGISAQNPPINGISPAEQMSIGRQGPPKPGYPLLPLRFSAKNRALAQGDTTTLIFVCFDFTNIAAIQFALKFDTAFLRFESVFGYPNSPLNVNTFGLFNIAEGEMRCVYSSATGTSFDDRTRLFGIRLVAQKNMIQISDHIRPAPEILPGIAADAYLISRPVILSLTEDLAEPKGGALHASVLFKSGQIFIEVPDSCDHVEIDLHDAGRRVYPLYRGFLHAGRHEFPLPISQSEGNVVLSIRGGHGEVRWLIKS